VPGTREIKGAVLGRLPTIQYGDCPLHFPLSSPSSLNSTRLTRPPTSFCFCRLDRGELAGFAVVLVTLPLALCHRRPLPHALDGGEVLFEVADAQTHIQNGIFCLIFSVFLLFSSPESSSLMSASRTFFIAIQTGHFTFYSTPIDL